MIRKGSCHCGAVKYTAQFPDERIVVSRCNCSICAMKGAVMAYVPLDALSVVEGEEAMACYQFNTRAAKHHFCSRCGIHLFHQPRSDPDKYAINVATLEGVRPCEDFTRVPVFDGQRHSSDHDGVRRQAGIVHFEPTPDTPWPDGVI